ncbi:pilin [Pseudomonas sp. PDM11]|uniref:pilin n=1 Tax=Pseudomonas sp. PDM11 TaxID=2769309 RepID=UPI0017832ECF|nr:pilin [Pseudomonas sp. PDM11]MBD9396448.1 pilin [Pseudomonas sp. PDM11]
MKAQMQKGFTLIELMIVVAIIGILAAVALPAYQDYTNRAKLTEVVTYLGAAKTGVAEAYASADGADAAAKLASINTARAGLDATATNNSTKYVQSVSVAAGVITATVRATGTACDGQTITLTPTTPATGDNLAWAGSASAACLKYVPANFRS